MLDSVIRWRDRMCIEINKCNTFQDLVRIKQQLDSVYISILPYDVAVKQGYSKYDMYFLLNLLMRLGKRDIGVSLEHTQETFVSYVYNVTIFTAKYLNLAKSHKLVYTSVLRDLADDNPEWLDVNNFFYTGLLVEYVNRFSFKAYSTAFKVECDYQQFPKKFNNYLTNLKIDFNPTCITIKAYDDTILVHALDYSVFNIALSDVL